MERLTFLVVTLLYLVSASTALSRLHVDVKGVERNNALGTSATEQAAVTNKVEHGASGFVISDHEDILCNYDLHADCAADYPENAEVVLVATPFPGSRFGGWEIPEAAKIRNEVYLGTKDIHNSYLRKPAKNPGTVNEHLEPPPSASAPEGPVSTRIRIRGGVVKVVAYFILNEIPTIRPFDDDKIDLEAPRVVLPVGVKQLVYTDKDAGALGEFIATGKKGEFTVSFHGDQLDDEVEAVVRDVVWICDDDVSRKYDALAVRTQLVGLDNLAQKEWKIESPVELPERGFCQVNITVFTDVPSNNAVPDVYTFSHFIRTRGFETAPTAKTHIFEADKLLATSWNYFSEFTTSIPAGVRLEPGKTSANRFKVRNAPPAGKYAMDINIQIKGTKIGSDAVTCTAGFVDFMNNKIHFPLLIDGTSGKLTAHADNSKSRNYWDTWFQPGSVKVKHFRRIIELENNQTPPEVVVVCKNLADTTILTNSPTGRSIAVGPIVVNFFELDTPKIHDSVVMNYRFGNMITKTPM